MPKIMMIAGYQISIGSNENDEPIHVYVSKKKPSPNNTKLWLLSNGAFVIAYNKSRIDEKELKKIIKRLNVVAGQVKASWIAYHGYEKYYR